MALSESGASLIYLADRSGRFLTERGPARYQTLQWLMVRMGWVGPMFGQIGCFHRFAGARIEDPRPKQRCHDGARRLPGVLDGRLSGRDCITGGDYTMADMATWPWIRSLYNSGVGQIVGLDGFVSVRRWFCAAVDRPASQAALNITDRNG